MAGMYHIALCDDETEGLYRTENILNLYRRQHVTCDFSVERFDNAEKMLQEIRKNEYSPDLLFMDIYMPGKNGIEVARELREMGNACRIVFLTASKEFALEAFRVDAFQYLIKPASEKDIFRILDRFIKETSEDEKYLLFRVEGSIRKVSVQDIIYCEAQKRHQYIYLTDGTYLVQSMTMAKVYAMLSGYQEFVKVGVSYIVSLKHIVGLNARELQMDDGKKIYLPRGAYQGLRKRYLNFYFYEEEGCRE